jgi:hypothetical protein
MTTSVPVIAPLTEANLPQFQNAACIAYIEAARLIQRTPRYGMPQHLTSIHQLRQLWEIDADAYAECAIAFECFRRWWQRYPQGNTVILGDGGAIIASMGIWALAPQQFEAFTSGQIAESALLPVPLSQCEKFPQHYWYISGLVLRQEYRGRPSSPLRHLLKHGIPSWLYSTHTAYPMHVAALGEYVEGNNLLENFGFKLHQSQNAMPDGCALYLLTIESEEQAEAALKSRSLG